jgi:hypothetical protein
LISSETNFDPHHWFEVLRRVCLIKSGKVDLRIPIVDDAGREVGHLEPITARHLIDQELLSTFVRWRNQNRVGYLDQRPVTEESTRSWLIDVATNPLRMAYLIFCEGRLVGRSGFVKLKPWEREADSLVRGERGGGMWFMHWAQMAGILWESQCLGSQSLVADVVSENELALENCWRLGYDREPFQRRRLFRTLFPDGEFWGVQGNESDVVPAVELLTFRLREQNFFEVARRCPALMQLEDQIRVLIQRLDG